MQGKLEARHNNYLFNFDVTKKVNSSSLYQVFACTNNHTATDNVCNYYEINQGTSPIAVHLRFSWQIKDHCGDSVRIIRSFAIVSCWQYKDNTGRIDVYSIDQNQGLYLIKSVECEYLECYLGKQIGIRDLRNDHIQVFYTLYSLNGIAQLDMMNVMRFYYNENNKYYYVKNVSENIISIDTALNRNLSFGVQDNYLIMKYLQLSTVLKSPICNYTQYFDGQNCVSCLSGQINMLPNTGICEYCGAPLSYSWTSFENLLRTQYCENYYSFTLTMLQNDDDQLRRDSSDTSLEPWQISLIVVLPALFLIVLALGLYCCFCKKDMKTIMAQIEKEEQQKIQRQQSQQVYNQHLNESNQDYRTPIKLLTTKFQKKIDTIGSNNDFDHIIGPCESQNKQESDEDVDIIGISNSFIQQNDQRLKPQITKTAVRQFENKNFPQDLLKFDLDVQHFHDTQQSDRALQSEEDSHTLQKMYHSFKHRLSSNTKSPSILKKPKKQHQIPQMIEAFKTSPRKELKEWIKQDPKFIEASSCIFCYHFFKLVDNIVQMKNCQKKIKHLAHTACLEKAINLKQIEDLDYMQSNQIRNSIKDRSKSPNTVTSVKKKATTTNSGNSGFQGSASSSRQISINAPTKQVISNTSSKKNLHQKQHSTLYNNNEDQKYQQLLFGSQTLQANQMISIVDNPVQSMKHDGDIDFTLGSQGAHDLFMNHSNSASSMSNSLEHNHFTHITNNNRHTINPMEENQFVSPKKEQKELVEGTNNTIFRETTKSLLFDSSMNSTMKVRLNIVPIENPICNVHQDLKMNLFCRDCEKNICQECFKLDEHATHTCEEIDQFLEFKKSSWSQYFLEQRSLIRQCMQGVDFVTWSTLDKDLQILMSDPFAKQKSLLQNLEEFENSINKMISQHNIKKLINYDKRREIITRTFYDFQQDINNFKTVSYLNSKIQRSEHLLDIESQLKALISKEIEDFKSVNKQELEYATNKLYQLESEILPQLELQQKQHSSDKELTQIKKSQSDIVTTVQELLKLKDQRSKDQIDLKNLQNQFKDFVFEFEKQRDVVGLVQGNVRTELRKLQTDIDKEQNRKIDEMITRIMLIEKELNTKIQGGFEKNQQIEVNINSMIEALKDNIDKQQDEIIKKHGEMIDQNEQNDAIVREQLKLLQIDVESLQDHHVVINKKLDLFQQDMSEAHHKIEQLEGALHQYIKSEVERRQMSWEVESGEEAEIQQQHMINTLILLSNQMVVSSSSQQLQNKYYLDVFDSDNDYEQLKTIMTYHQGQINCMIEHNKVLLTGSYDQTIGIWDIYNDFQILQQLDCNEITITSLLSIDNRYFVSACIQGSLRIWDSVGYKQVCNKQTAHKIKVNNIQLISKYRLVSCSNDKTAITWQLQGSDMIKLCEFPHNSFVVSSQQIQDDQIQGDLLLTCTQQGYIFIWDIQQSQSIYLQGNQPQPIKMYKLDAPKSLFQTMLIQDYDYKLFPYIIFKTLNEVYVMQVTTGKQVKVPLNLLLDLQHNKGGELEKFVEQRKIIQVDTQHIIIADGNKIRVVSLEINVNKDSLVSSSQNKSLQQVIQKQTNIDYNNIKNSK